MIFFLSILNLIFPLFLLFILLNTYSFLFYNHLCRGTKIRKFSQKNQTLSLQKPLMEKYQFFQTKLSPYLSIVSFINQFKSQNGDYFRYIFSIFSSLKFDKPKFHIPFHKLKNHEFQNLKYHYNSSEKECFQMYKVWQQENVSLLNKNLYSLKSYILEFSQRKDKAKQVSYKNYEKFHKNLSQGIIKKELWEISKKLVEEKNKINSKQEILIRKGIKKLKQNCDYFYCKDLIGNFIQNVILRIQFVENTKNLNDFSQNQY